ncbi:type IV pilus assembly PilZ [Desulfocucumis palustris]|uniref:Type IV pilus assembly PilZ n=1 Tax=Desulfocucumis palustris TaxID=1898651 RepID=A0A2L2XCQ0_9FIRM|nr:PilZ domain-containing protein [Desulfocucumis palustris]GBF31996.1 type IV pilus assembly PilZ [Desulfocucumis palustris]
MSTGEKITIREKQEVWLREISQPGAIPTTVTKVEGEIFWIGLPRHGGQVMMLLENQPVQVSVSYQKSFFCGDSKVAAIGKDFDKFYGLTIPEEFNPTRERRFIRANYPVKVIFRTDDLSTQTVLVNFSAGGAMVYSTPEIEKIINSNIKATMSLRISNYDFKLEVQPAWLRKVGDKAFAGFEFTDLMPALQGALAALAVKYK